MTGFLLHAYLIYCAIFCICNQLGEAEPLFGENVRKARKNEFPIVALIKVRAEHTRDYKYCSGSLLSRKYVLTAAQCVPSEHSPIHNVNVCLGSARRSKCKCYDSRTWITFNKWSKQKKKRLEFELNDIAVITLKKETSESLVPKLPTIPEQVKDQFCSWAVRLVGWGCIGATQDHDPPILKTTSVKVMTKEECDLAIKDTGEKYSNKVVLCTFAEPEVILNNADIGGPLFCDSRIVGVNVGRELVRFPNSNEFTSVSVHVSTNYYKEFINDVAKLR